MHGESQTATAHELNAYGDDLQSSRPPRTQIMGLSEWIFYKLFLKSEIMSSQWPSVGLSSHGLGPATFGTQ